MASDGRQQTQHPRVLRSALLAIAAVLAIAVFAAPASADLVYDNAPAAGAAEVASLGFAESGTAELGSLLQLAGNARLDPQVRVEATVDCADEQAPVACETPGATFSLPATLSVYAVGSDGAPGALLARQTETFQLSCDAALQPLAFSLAGVTLPAEAIFSIAFDTSESGYAPTAVAGPADAVGIALAGPPAAGANPREAEGVYRAAAADDAAPVFAFAAEPLAWQGRQPAFTVEASVPAAAVAAPTSAAATSPAAATSSVATTTRSARREYAIPPSKRMTVSFPNSVARIAGPGALVQVRCTGSSAARCIGTLSLTAAGTVHKAPFSISKGRRQYVVVPLGDDLALLDGLHAARVTATASTVQSGGAAVRTKRALKLK
jgi:hypothetical protein